MKKDLYLFILTLSLAFGAWLQFSLPQNTKAAAGIKKSQTHQSAKLQPLSFAHSNKPTQIGQNKDSAAQISTQLNPPPKPIIQASPIDSSHFQTMSEIFFRDIPKVSQLQGLRNSQVHSLAEPVRVAAGYLARARDFFVEHPQPAEVEMKFYLQCAEARDLFDSIRAVCAARMSQKFKELTGQEVNDKLFEPQVAELKKNVDL